MGLTVGQVQAAITTSAAKEAKTMPPSIQADIDFYGKKDVKELSPSLVIHSAESVHSPESGKISGLDADELKVIGEIAPEKMEAYERMQKSEVNQKYLKADMEGVTANLQRAQESYDSAQKELKGNWFTNMFRSDKTKAEQQAKANKAASALKYAQQEYDGYSKNVISYRTILERNGGMEF